MTDLSDVTSDELLDELRSRYDSMVFCGIQLRQADQAMYHPYWNGETMQCIGLAGYAQAMIIGDFHDHSSEAEE